MYYSGLAMGLKLLLPRIFFVSSVCLSPDANIFHFQKRWVLIQWGVWPEKCQADFRVDVVELLLQFFFDSWGEQQSRILYLAPH